MSTTSNLPYADGMQGRDHGSGAKETFGSGSECDFESGAALKLAGTQLTLNASEANTLDGIPTDWPTLILGEPTINAGAEAGNVINVAIQLNDLYGDPLTTSGAVLAWLSDDSGGDGLCAAAPDGDVAIGTDGAILVELTADKMFWLFSESDGDIDIDVGESTNKTFYLAVLVNGIVYVETLDFD